MQGARKGFSLFDASWRVAEDACGQIPLRDLPTSRGPALSMLRYSLDEA